MRRFNRSFVQQAALPQAAVEAAVRVLESSNLHRYGEFAGSESETSQLEREFADWQGARYCLACASGGQALQLAMRAAGVKAGDAVLTNAFTLAPVPGAIGAVGGRSVLVEVSEDLVLDVADLDAKAEQSGAKFLLLSHMRGHVADMDGVMEVARARGLTVIEDCAHTMGATWDGKKSGNFGLFGCFSTQTYKHLNSGEGGFLTTDDPNAMARAIIMSGSYMNFDRHGAAPDASYFAEPKYDCPNMSARMDNLRAAILRPQLGELDDALEGWRQRAAIVETALAALAPLVHLPVAADKADRVGSSVQFRLPDCDAEQCRALIANLAARGVEVKWFGAEEPEGFTSLHHHWRYVEAQSLPRTDAILRDVFDLRLPLSFSLADCDLLAEILCEEITSTIEKTP